MLRIRYWSELFAHVFCFTICEVTIELQHVIKGSMCGTQGENVTMSLNYEVLITSNNKQ
jgi:hypothetical protein